MDGETDLTIRDSGEWSYEMISDFPELVAELQDCERRAQQAGKLLLEDTLAIASQVARAWSAFEEARRYKGELYIWARVRLGLRYPELVRGLLKLHSTFTSTDELGSARFQAHPLIMSLSAWGAYGNAPDEVRAKVNAGGIDPYPDKIRDESVKVKAREDAEKLAQKEAELSAAQQETEALLAELNAARERSHVLETRFDWQLAKEAKAQEKEIRQELKAQEKQMVIDLKARMEQLTEEYNEARSREEYLEQLLHSPQNPIPVRKKWREAGERLLTEIGRMAAVGPMSPAVEIFEARDWNELSELLHKLRHITTLLEALQPIEAVHTADNNNHYYLPAGSVVGEFE